MKKDYLNDKKRLPIEVKKTIIIIVVAIILLVVMYFLTTVILNKESKDSDRVIENAIQYDEILAGESFNKNGEYYVIYYDSTDDYSTISSLVSSYQLNGTGTKLYSVDLSNTMNRNYIVENEESDINTDNASSLKVKVNTLIKFKDKEAVEVITDLDEITNILNN